MKAGMGWPIGVATILACTVAANVVVMRIASDDPSFAVEPDYYRKAVHFDSTMAQERQNLSLGWGFDAAIDSIGTSGRTRLAVRLRDASQAPLTGARVAVMARFNARANDTLTALLTEEGPGVYAATLPITHSGEWEVRVDATHGSQRYSTSARVTAVHALAAASEPALR